MNSETQSCGINKSCSDSEEMELDIIVNSLREIDEALEELMGRSEH